ncbi:unnamed protein product [Mytilus edulis]|uniref:Transposase domain-containing protein n=1 Tax=Mytilus edulis TaxID=6550 RepID=A0A8S3PUP6_MYTED|nr:unnamed protein product [Mytilus edulis]
MPCHTETLIAVEGFENNINEDNDDHSSYSSENCSDYDLLSNLSDDDDISTGSILSDDDDTNFSENSTDQELETSAESEFDYEHLWKYLDDDFANEFHYCESCFELFPADTDTVRCGKCNNPRFKMLNKVKQPRASFVMANINRQLKNLLQSPGIWEDVLKNKNYIRNRYLQDNETITDITDGSLYRKLLSENDFLNGTDNTNLTAVINTDGVSLYSSSKVQLWPIFMAVNELNPCARFARENVILAGIWQGKGKPPFNTFIGSFCKLMNDLYDTGITEKLNGEETTVKLKVICGIYDLPAKAAILNMTQYNGSDSCITCEEPGKTVKQGKGTSRCFPYRETAEKYPNRNQAGVKLAMERGTERNRIKGFKGTSPLLDLKNFDIVSGTPPDYMHGVLLGVTKTLLYKWFSSTEKGILPNKYLEHFACLAEGVYFLLGDKISKNDLQRAHILLDAFFRNFSNLYPAGSCGLNVHNIGMHMVEYVRVLGPLWSWSCFPFEDCNSMITKTVHGTGDVTKQVMKIKEAQALLRNNLPLIFKGKKLEES